MSEFVTCWACDGSARHAHFPARVCGVCSGTGKTEDTPAHKIAAAIAGKRPGREDRLVRDPQRSVTEERYQQAYRERERLRR